MSIHKITFENGFRPFSALSKAARDPRVEEIEGEGCDPGRVLIHLVEGYWFEHYESTSKGVGDAEDVAYAMEMIRPRPKVSR